LLLKFKTGELVKIHKINNKAEHLKEYEGKLARIISWIIKDGTVRYKLMLVENNDEIFYCREGEIKKV
jgi:hypothetical protein